MSTHPDAIGYLSDLSTEINEPWFKMVCDLSVACGASDLDQLTCDTLSALYTKRASYIGIKTTIASVVAPASGVPLDFLDQLSGFENFKLLGCELEIKFQKRITLIFGANGSGKSSLCESLKVLASPETPSRPLHNLRMAGKASPTFHYKFKNDAVLQTWSPAVGYGPKRATVKYFDNAIAIKNVQSAVEPGRIIILTPFRLQVFEYAKEITTKFREVLQNAQRDNAAKLTQALETIRTEFEKFKGRPLASIDDKTAKSLLSQINLAEGFTEQELLRDKLLAIADLEKATSEEGFKLLKAEHRELESVLESLSTLLTSASSLWALTPVSKAKTLAEKQIEQEALAKALIPEEGTLDGLLSLLRAASPFCRLDAATGDACPLCKRILDTTEVDLFKQYYDLLAGEIENDITKLKNCLTEAGELVTAVDKVDRAAWDKCTTIQQDILKTIKTGSDSIVDSCDVSKEPTVEAKAAHEMLSASVITWATQLKSKKDAIGTAEGGREELVRQLAKLRREIEPLEYKQAIVERLAKLRETQQIVNEATFWSTNLPGFTQVLKKITVKAKEAHEGLVVADFEARLNEEYKALAEKDMAAFGVVLFRKGTDAAVMVLPQIGGRDIEGVLSEGAQRVHALALFFAELETCPQSVLVFDDPISSFDYNYTANYCARMRDFTLKHPEKQIIVLTHSWEFFVQLQTILNKAGLDSLLSVHVMENCTVVADYTEKIDELKRDIEAILAAAGEPTKAKKEEAAGEMRRLIEAVINTHVFNHQRHQYKQKSQAITAFPSFTKIVALLPEEANVLRDLYAKLSITEHDDPRTAYANTDKAIFQTRYDQIVKVETAIKTRIP